MAVGPGTIVDSKPKAVVGLQENVTICKRRCARERTHPHFGRDKLDDHDILGAVERLD
jgi:hypothetical protein